MLVQRLQRWLKIDPTYGQYLVLTGLILQYCHEQAKIKHLPFGFARQNNKYPVPVSHN